MGKDFPWKIDEAQLLPPRVQDYVPKDHLSRPIVAPVTEELDLSTISGSYTSVLGQPPFDPRMVTALLLHGYASGIYSSRRIAKAAVERADFMMIVAGNPPDFRTIPEFRRRHLQALAWLFVQVLKLAVRRPAWCPRKPQPMPVTAAKQTPRPWPSDQSRMGTDLHRP
jgi:transposase